jgi:hypothetical protein
MRKIEGSDSPLTTEVRARAHRLTVAERYPCIRDGAALLDSLTDLDHADVVCIGSPLSPDAIRILFGGSAVATARRFVWREIVERPRLRFVAQEQGG